MTPRTLIPAALVAVFALLMILLQGAWSARDAARRETAAARARTASAEAQVQLDDGAARAVQAAQTREITLTIQAKEAAHDIARSAGGDAPVPADVLARWADAVDGLRLDGAGRPDAADGSVGRGAAGALSAPATAGGAERG